MTREQRNSIFKEYQNIIYFTVRRHKGLQEVLRMDADDLAQELSISLLKAIEQYNPSRGAKPSTYYIKKLRYAALNLWREQTREKRLVNISTVSLTCSDENGEAAELDISVEVDYDSPLLVEEFMNTLSIRERSVLERKINGYEPGDIRHRRYMGVIRKKAQRFCAIGGAA